MEEVKKNASNKDNHNTEKTELQLKVVLPITSIGIVLAALDGSIVNVSLRTIAGDLGTDEAGISWVVIAYLLTITSLMGLGGGLGDVYGRKKVFQTGMHFGDIRWNEKEQYYEDRYYECDACGTKAGFAYNY